jgi:hypothetical protein
MRELARPTLTRGCDRSHLRVHARDSAGQTDTMPRRPCATLIKDGIRCATSHAMWHSGARCHGRASGTPLLPHQQQSDDVGGRPVLDDRASGPSKRATRHCYHSGSKVMTWGPPLSLMIGPVGLCQQRESGTSAKASSFVFSPSFPLLRSSFYRVP